MRNQFPVAVWAGIVMGLTASLSLAETRADCEKVYRPQTGQAGKDVIWVPTNDALVERMLKMANTSSADLVYDLGAGDGKIAIAAAKQFGARAVGIEYEADMARYAQCLVKAEGVSDKVRVMQGDIFETDFSAATVVTLYLLPELNLRLRPTLLKMKPGTRIVSHSFLMDDWEPDDRSMTQDGSAYLWIVPAQVGGTWTFVPQGGKGERFVAQFDQTFQIVKGAVTMKSGTHELVGGKVRGPDTEFTFDQGGKTVRFKGRLENDRINVVLMSDDQPLRYLGTKS